MEISNSNATFLENTDVVEKKESGIEVYTIINPAMARPLIKMRASDGISPKHNLLDISPHKERKNASVYTFVDSLALRKDMQAISKAHRRAKEERAKKSSIEQEA